LVVAEQAVEM
jgi:hypothetical protein